MATNISTSFESADALKVQRWMAGIGLEQLKVFSRRRLGLQAEVRHNPPKTLPTPDVSKIAFAACVSVRIGFGDQCIKFSGLLIPCDLLIPQQLIALQKPGAQFCVLVRFEIFQL
jgi:hypothetical protein